MATQPLMPKATAVWLIDNSSLTFEQIAKFCGLHLLEIESIADGNVAQGIKGQDPILTGQITREALKRCEEDPKAELILAPPAHDIPKMKKRRGPRYTPVSRRRDRPDAIEWLVRNHPELSNGQIARLVGTTKRTIEAVRDRTHWNSMGINPVDPVTLSLCSQSDLDEAVRKAANRNSAETEEKAKVTVLKAAEKPEEDAPDQKRKDEKDAAKDTVDTVFAETHFPKTPPAAAPAPLDIKNPSQEKKRAKEKAESAFAKLADLRKNMDGEKEG